MNIYRFKEYGYRLILVTCLLMMALVMTGCSLENPFRDNKDNGDSASTSLGYSIYYVNLEETHLTPISYQLTETTEEGIIEECLLAMRSDPDDSDFKSVFSGQTDYLKYSYDHDSRILSFYFGERYKSLSKTSEILVRAAIVKTMTQFGGIVNYVSFNIDNHWITDDDDQILLMKYSDYETDVLIDPDLLADVTLTLYFASEDGKGLVPVETSIKHLKTQSLEELVLKSLIRGPQGEDGGVVLSNLTRVRSVSTRNGICTVDLNQAFLEPQNDQPIELNIYSVVNSLCELDEVEGVMLLVDGEPLNQETNEYVMMDTLVMNRKIIKEK